MLTVGYCIEDLAVGGAERLVVALANRLDRARFRPVVICLSRRGTLWEALRNDVGRAVLDKRPGVDPTLPGRLRRQIQQMGVDVLHTHLFTGNTWGRLAGLSLPGLPVVTTIHNTDVWKRAPHRIVDHLLAPSNAVWVAVSDAVGRHAVRTEGVRPRRLRVIHNGVDLDRFRGQDRAEARREWGLDADQLAIGFVGRLVPQKSPGVLVAAFAGLAGKRRGARLLLVGAGPLENALKEQIDRLGLQERACLVGERDDIARLLAALDVFVMPSLREGLPLALLEAMASGCAAVASNIPGIDEVVTDERDGLLVAPGDADSLARALARLADAPQRRRSLGEAARQRMEERFSLDRCVSAYETLYRELP